MAMADIRGAEAEDGGGCGVPRSESHHAVF